MAEQDTSFGPNAWLVDEMYDQYRADPSSVSESWRDFFSDDRDGDGSDGARKAPVQTATETAQKPDGQKGKPAAKPSGGTKRRDDDARDDDAKDRQPASD